LYSTALRSTRLTAVRSIDLVNLRTQVSSGQGDGKRGGAGEEQGAHGFTSVDLDRQAIARVLNDVPSQAVYFMGFIARLP
jgi:hypothetical protein